VTWTPPLTGEPQAPDGDADREKYSEKTGVSADALLYSDFIIGGRCGEVDDVLRGVYKEAREAFGQEFKYPEN